MHRPDLTDPSGRERGTVDHLHTRALGIAGDGSKRCILRAVDAVVVDDDNLQGARIILRQQRAHGVFDALGLVPGRNNGDHTRSVG